MNSWRTWTGLQRTPQRNWRLGAVLCAVAGATNAGGFLAVHQYTSHMSGMVSSVADQLVLGQWDLAWVGVAAVLAFVAGAMCSAWVVHWCLRRRLASSYARPLVLEAFLLLVFGLFGAGIDRFGGGLIPPTMLLLCFLMGLQNALITKVSKSEIRTTHITGLVTDLGIELGRSSYLHGADKGLADPTPVRADRRRMRLLTALIACFFVGGIVGALSFKAWGYGCTVPLAAVLIILSWPALSTDWRNWRQSPTALR